MTLNIYAIKDTKVAFKQPFYTHNDSVAERMFRNAVNDQEHQSELSLNPQDHELWYLGKYDDETGSITECTPKFICKGIDLVNKKEN